MNWHLLPTSEISRLLSTSPAGIDKVTAQQRLVEYGSNTIENKKAKTPAKIIARQFADFMTAILVVAAVVSGMLGDLQDTFVILAITVINATVGFTQEFRVEKAMKALKGLIVINAQVIRDGKVTEVLASDLVPGDVVLLEAGNIIPADVRFFQCDKLSVDESSLTGEAHNTEKITDELPDEEYALGDRINMGFKGTVVTNGRALAYVVATGKDTELALIAGMIQAEDPQTPLQRKLSSFGKRLAIAVLILCGVVFFSGLLRREDFVSMLLTSVSLAVAAIPEALPIVITVALAIGARRLAGKNALIRRLSAVETLGSVTYICADKTGTLTQNKITVQQVIEVKRVNDFSLSDPGMLLTAITLNNDASQDIAGIWHGESTEIALAQYADSQNYKCSALQIKYPRLAEIPFEPERKCMTTLHKWGEEVLVITKGAPDVLFEKLVGDQVTAIAEYEDVLNVLTAKGYRVLGYAVKRLPSAPEKLVSAKIETSLMFVGFAAMIDPPREEVKSAVNQCREANIVPVMITGDHKHTAVAIARQLGIISSEDNVVMTGAELSKLSADEFENVVEKVRVYARVNPEQKLKIVTALQDRGHLVAMTGDGVNDAPALKNADIGIAMGINGTEVAKEAAHMILLDDNFATIVAAVSYGRRVWDNIMKFIKYIMTGNSGELWTILLAPVLGLPIPLLPIHILWVNLLSDGLPGLALASEPAEKTIMSRPPANPNENIFSKPLVLHILWVGFLIGLITIMMEAGAIKLGNYHWQTMTFTVLCFIQLGHIVAIRSDRESIFRLGLFSNNVMMGTIGITFILQLTVIYVPVFNKLFKTQPLSLAELVVTIIVSTMVFWAVEVEKLIKRRRGNHKSAKATTTYQL